MTLDNSIHESNDFPTVLVLIVIMCFLYFSMIVEERRTNRYY